MRCAFMDKVFTTKDKDEARMNLEKHLNDQNCDYCSDDQKVRLLHQACEEGDSKLVEILLKRNPELALASKTNKNVQTEELALHRVVRPGCFCSTCDTKAYECARLLLNTETKLNASNQDKSCSVNFQNKDKKTPFYLAAENRFIKCGRLMLAHGADLVVNKKAQQQNAAGVGLTVTNETDMETSAKLKALVIKNIPEAVLVCLDNSIRLYKEKLVVDFSFLIHKQNPKSQTEVEKLPEFTKEVDFLHQMLSAEEEAKRSILSHPVTKAFMHKKWRIPNVLFRTLRFAYLTLGIAYCIFLYSHYRYKCPYIQDPKNQTSQTTIGSHEYCPFIPFDVVLAYISAILPLYTIAYLISTKFPQKYRNGKLFKLDEDVLWIAFVLVVGFTLLPGLFWWNTISEEYYATAAFGALFVCTMFVVQLEQEPYFSKYIHILAAILKSAFLVMVVFVFLILGFVLGFHIVFPSDEHPLGNPIMSFMRVLLLMIGDSDYDGVFGDLDPDGLLFVPAQILYASFIILITVVFMNFLIGVSINDINKLEQGAKVSQIKSQLSLIQSLEDEISSDVVFYCIRNYLKRKLSAVNGRPVTAGSRSEIYVEDDQLPAAIQQELVQKFMSSEFEHQSNRL